MEFKIGDYVKRNFETWVPNNFDVWGRWIGIGLVFEAPFSTTRNQVDVRCPGGRCFEHLVQLLPATKLEYEEQSS